MHLHSENNLGGDLIHTTSPKEQHKILVKIHFFIYLDNNTVTSENRLPVPDYGNV